MKKKILIVDDEPGILSALEDVLTLEGYEVIIANNGREGLSLAGQRKPDLIILDIMMPKMDGPTMARSLRDSPASVDTPIIFLTGLLQRTEQHSQKAAGGDYVLAKPFRDEELVAMIREVLG